VSILRAILLGVSFLALAPVIFASSAADEPNPFRKTYLHFGLASNTPEGRTQSNLSPGRLQPAFAYLHNIDTHWIMGLGGGLKTFERPNRLPLPPSRTLAIWTLRHSTSYVVRLSHPSYLLFGPQLLYLLPTTTGKPPPQRDHWYEAEVGVGLSVELIRGMSDRWFLSLRAERWRGTNTSRLAGFETGFGIMVALD